MAIATALFPRIIAQTDRTALVVAMLISIVASVLILRYATCAAERIEAKSKASVFLKQLIASDATITPFEATALVILFTFSFAALVWAMFP
jgi:hypothetical protein